MWILYWYANTLVVNNFVSKTSLQSTLSMNMETSLKLIAIVIPNFIA